MDTIREFPTSVIERIGFYVYLLIDPRTEEVFYVGKGLGNRVFHHVSQARHLAGDSNKSERIRDIQMAGLEVTYRIHRHGLSEKEAFEVEAALIDFVGLPELANAVEGHESNNRGSMNVSELVAMYNAPNVMISEPSILIRVNRLYQRGIDADRLYEITRGNWVVGKRREKAHYAFSIYSGIVREVYRIKNWFPVTARTLTQKTRNRWRFDGTVAVNMQHYVGGSVDSYMSSGNQNPIKYVNC